MQSRIILYIIIFLSVAGTVFALTSKHTTHESSVVPQATADSDSAANTNTGLVPRTLPVKPEHASVPAGFSLHTISVKFIDGLDIGIGSGGFPVDRSGATLNTTTATTLMESVKTAGGKWFPASATVEQKKKIDDLRAEAEKSGHVIADLNNYFTLVMPAKEDTTKWMDLLNGLPEVEIAVPAANAAIAG